MSAPANWNGGGNTLSGWQGMTTAGTADQDPTNSILNGPNPFVIDQSPSSNFQAGGNPNLGGMMAAYGALNTAGAFGSTPAAAAAAAL